MSSSPPAPFVWKGREWSEVSGSLRDGFLPGVRAVEDGAGGLNDGGDAHRGLDFGFADAVTFKLLFVRLDAVLAGIDCRDSQ